MSVVVLVPTLRENSVGRAASIAGYLNGLASVSIIGPRGQSPLWPGIVAGKQVSIQEISAEGSFASWLDQADKMGAGCDALIVTKSATLPWRVLAGLQTAFGTRVWFDVDDWELGLRLDGPRRLKPRATLRLIWQIRQYLQTERWLRQSSQTIAANSLLADRYGATITIPHIHPNLLSAKNLSEKRVRTEVDHHRRIELCYAGTPHRYKGLEDLIHVLAKRRGFTLLVLGVAETRFGKALHKQVKQNKIGNVILQPPAPHKDFIARLAASDAVVIPQRKSPATRMQTPMKLFDAMAVGVPIIAARTDPIEEVLGKNAIYFEPGSQRELSQAIDWFAANRQEALARAARAQQHFLKRYSRRMLAEDISALFLGRPGFVAEIPSDPGDAKKSEKANSLLKNQPPEKPERNVPRGEDP